ncbi:MAG: ABC transporter permease, partial [Alphaproteobacteria bacterium]|nr:ABC transporter permease [Alphaproteobacteria bacterium]
MRIVGASAAWVRLPFILEGLAIGAAGALITL